jgi:bifunctional non-homologous end joining protein LigD
MELLRQAKPFDDADWVFEVKMDGFRALAYVERGGCRLLSRKGKEFKGLEPLRSAIAGLKAERAILDGELVCLDAEGRPRFYDLMFRRREPFFYAFDLLWQDDRDLRSRSLLERKEHLRALVPGGSRLLYLDHVPERGVDLFGVVCEHDLEGIVAKPKASPYLSPRNRPLWIKIKNPDYTQANGRHEVFDAFRERKSS